MYITNAERATPYPTTPTEHAGLLHPPKAKGRAFVPRKVPPDGAWMEGDAHAPWELDAVLWDAGGGLDRYVSMNRFAGESRTVADYLELCAIFSDCDYYNVSGLMNLPPKAVLRQALDRLREAGVPDPSLVLSSGRGLQLAWLHEPLVRNDMPLSAWNAVQNGLYRLLEPFGADPKARHAATVLRMAGTENSKNGAMTRVLREPREGLYRFEDLAEALVKDAPREDDREQAGGGADLYSIAVRRAARGLRNHPRGWSDVSLWEGRLTDLQHLRRLRYGPGVMKDHRDRWLFIATTAISWLVVPEVLDREVMALAGAAGGWDRGRARSDLGQVLKRARRAAAGEQIEFEGQLWDPRHHFRNETIVDWLEVTRAEEREMVVTISDDERRRRDGEYRRKKRRADGVPTRAEYENKRSAAKERKVANARHLLKCGLSTEEVAQSMGVSQRTVQRWAK